MIPTKVMASSTTLLLLLLLAACIGWARSQATGFYKNYNESWGGDRIKVLNGQTEVVLSMDKNSGSGFGSKLKYGSGWFHLRIKLPPKNTAGVVTAFYLASDSKNNHAELDFEFLGNLEGKPIILQTNVFANGKGNREQRIKLWFDPSADFHDYKILWNTHQIVFYVDNTAIRVFANKQKMGVGYPTQPMQIIASLWNGEDWATNGGKTKIDWSYAPFNVHFQGFNVDGCVTSPNSIDPRCSSSSSWWNSERYQQLTSSEKLGYEEVKKRFLTYDYCSDVKRFPKIPLECTH